MGTVEIQYTPTVSSVEKKNSKYYLATAIMGIYKYLSRLDDKKLTYEEREMKDEIMTSLMLVL